MAQYEGKFGKNILGRNSCAGNCGTYDGNASCQCDSACTSPQYSDCCSDFCQACPELDSPYGGNGCEYPEGDPNQSTTWCSNLCEFYGWECYDEGFTLSYMGCTDADSPHYNSNAVCNLVGWCGSGSGGGDFDCDVSLGEPQGAINAVHASCGTALYFDPYENSTETISGFQLDLNAEFCMDNTIDLELGSVLTESTVDWVLGYNHMGGGIVRVIIYPNIEDPENCETCHPATNYENAGPILVIHYPDVLLTDGIISTGEGCALPFDNNALGSSGCISGYHNCTSCPDNGCYYDCCDPNNGNSDCVGVFTDSGEQTTCKTHYSWGNGKGCCNHYGGSLSFCDINPHHPRCMMKPNPLLTNIER